MGLATVICQLYGISKNLSFTKLTNWKLFNWRIFTKEEVYSEVTSEGTDESYIRQIQSYNEHAKHDDAPDSLASAIRLFETRTKVIGMRPF